MRALAFLIAMVFGIHIAAAQDQPSGVNGVDLAKLKNSARASKIFGSSVYNGGDTSIGHIEDVLLDLGNGSITAIVLSVGGFLGVGNKLVAVPLNQIHVSSEARFITDLTKDQLTNAPAYSFGASP